MRPIVFMASAGGKGGPRHYVASFEPAARVEAWQTAAVVLRRGDRQVTGSVTLDTR